MGGRAALAFIVIVLLAPLAGASDPTREQTCVDANNCAGPGTCTPFACVPRSCQPLLFCRSDVSTVSECEVNMSIDGQTCQLVLGVGGRTNLPGQAFWVALSLTDGNVDAFNLPNTWITPAAQAQASANGVDTGSVSVGAYRSDIITDGQRGGVLGLLTPSSQHQWTHLALVVSHGPGVTAGEDIVVGVYFLDSMPEGCYARAPAVGVPEALCPPLPRVL